MFYASDISLPNFLIAVLGLFLLIIGAGIIEDVISRWREWRLEIRDAAKARIETKARQQLAAAQPDALSMAHARLMIFKREVL